MGSEGVGVPSESRFQRRWGVSISMSLSSGSAMGEDGAAGEKALNEDELWECFDGVTLRFALAS